MTNLRVLAMVVSVAMAACGVDATDELDDVVQDELGAPPAAIVLDSDWQSQQAVAEMDAATVMQACDDVCASAGFTGVLGGPVYWCAASTGECQCVQPQALACVPGDHAVVLPR